MNPDQLVQFTANATGPVRKRKMWGREWLVVPATLVRNQVLENNLGKTYLPAEEVTEGWARTANGSPVLTDHPTKRGFPASGRDPDVMDKIGVGFLFNARVDRTGSVPAVKADVYLDPERVEAVEDLGTIIAKLEKRQPVELSTGFPLRELERRSGVFNGRKYDKVLRPAAFDHLALFAEHKKGACSLEDGCGLLVNRRESARPASEIEFSDTETAEERPWGEVDTTLEAFVSAYGTDEEEGSDVADLSDSTRAAIAARTILGDAEAETEADLVSVPIVNPSTDNLNEGALNAAAAAAGGARGADLPDPDGIQSTVDSLREDHFADEEEDEDMEDEAENLLRTVTNALRKLVGLSPATNQEDISLDDRRRLVEEALDGLAGGQGVWVHVPQGGFREEDVVYEVDPQGGEAKLFRIPYTVEDGEVELAVEDRVEVRRVTEFVPVENEDGTGAKFEARYTYRAVNPTPEEGDDMRRDELVNALCECESVPFRRETLEGMSDEELLHVANGSGVELEDPEGSGSGDGATDDGGEGPEGSDPQPTAEDGEAANQLLGEVRDMIRSEVQNLREDLAPAIEEGKRERKSMISHLAQNERCPFEEEELEGKTTDELRKLYSMSRGVSYAPKGGPKRTAHQEAEDAFMDPTPYYATQEGSDSGEED